MMVPNHGLAIASECVATTNHKVFGKVSCDNEGIYRNDKVAVKDHKDVHLDCKPNVFSLKYPGA